MHLNFLDLSRPVLTEVVAGRLSAKRAKLMLQINSDIVVANAVKERLRIWKMAGRRHEKVQNEQCESNSARNSRRIS